MRHTIQRVLLHSRFELFEANRMTIYVVVVVQTLVDQNAHHAESERGIRSGVDRNVPVRTLRCARPIGINHDQLRALSASLFNKRPQMDIVSVNVGCPGNDVARMCKLLGFSTYLHAENRLQSFFARGRADGPFELRSPKTVEEAAIHGAAIQGAQVAAIGIGQDTCRNRRVISSRASSQEILWKAASRSLFCGPFGATRRMGESKRVGE